MYKFIQRNQKKMLAIFGVLLMIVFVLPNTLGQGSFSDPVEGRLAGDGGKIRLSDKKRADADVDVLARHNLLPLVLNLAPYEVYARPEMGRLAGQVAQELHQNPELWVMLVREAEQAGIRPAEAEVRNLIEQVIDPATPRDQVEDRLEPAIRRMLMVRSSFQRFANSMKATHPLVQSELAFRQGVRLNLVELKAEDFVNQVPAPTAEQVQKHYEAYRNNLPAPRASFAATQPVQSGYRVSDRVKIQYVQLPAEQVVDSFLKTKVNDQERYQLKIAANLYHRASPKEFQTTGDEPPAAAPLGPALPATQPTTGPTTAPATHPAGPTTKPLEQVEGDIIRRLVRGEISPPGDFPRVRDSVSGVQKRFIEHRDALRDELRDQLQKDYLVHHGPTTAPSTRPAAAVAARPTTGPTTGPSAEVVMIRPVVGKGDPFEQVDYLKKIAEDFEKKNGVRPLVHSVTNEWQTEKELGALPGISDAIANVPGGGQFTDLALRRRESLRQPTTRTTQPTEDEARLFEPSPILTDRSDNAYVFRVTAWHPEHVPPLDEVREQVVKDLKLIAAYDLAREQAKKLLEAAGSLSLAGATTRPTTGPATSPTTAPTTIAGVPTTAPSGGLPATAAAAGRTALSVGPIESLAMLARLEKIGAGQQFQIMQQMMQMKIPGYEFNEPFSVAKINFLRGVAPLVEQVTPAQRHPGKVVELPTERKVLAVEAADLLLDWPEEEDHRQRLRLAQQAEQSLEADLAIQWFDKAGIMQRVGYTPSNPEKPTTNRAAL